MKHRMLLTHASQLLVGSVLHKLMEDGSTYNSFKVKAICHGGLNQESIVEMEGLVRKAGNNSDGKTQKTLMVPIEFVLGNPSISIENSEQPIDWELRELEAERALLDMKIRRRKAML